MPKSPEKESGGKSPNNQQTPDNQQKPSLFARLGTMFKKNTDEQKAAYPKVPIN